MSWEGTRRTSKYRNMLYKFYQLASSYSVACLNLFRKDWNLKATAAPQTVTNATLIVEARPPDSRAPPCPFRGTIPITSVPRTASTHISNVMAPTSVLDRSNCWASHVAKLQRFFSHQCFFSFAVQLFERFWKVNLILDVKNAREARQVIVACPEAFLFSFFGRQCSWTKAWWCGNHQYSFWMNAPQPWILSHRRRHRKPSWRISPGAEMRRLGKHST